MYLSYYNLKHKPFQISTDPNFLWLGEKHMEALSTLRYGVLDNKGFLLLTGDVGTGKTTLINALLKTLGNDFLVAAIRDPDLEPLDFFQYTAHRFGLKKGISSKGTFLIQFEQFLYRAHEHGKKALLIIDEAQRINQRLLEEVRLLSNIERNESKLLNIFFVGQIEFNEILLRPVNRPIRQRITINYNIETLSAEETEQYIKHRLAIASRNSSPRSRGVQPEAASQNSTDTGKRPSSSAVPGAILFTDGAISEIHRFSNGYPRLINIICDRCLLTSYVEESRKVLPRHVQECAKELEIPSFKTGEKRKTSRSQDESVHNPALPQRSEKRQPGTDVIQPITELAIQNEVPNRGTAENRQIKSSPPLQSASGSKGRKILKVLGTGAAFSILLLAFYFSFFRDSGFSSQVTAALKGSSVLEKAEVLVQSFDFKELFKKIDIERTGSIAEKDESDSAGKSIQRNPLFQDEQTTAVPVSATANDNQIDPKILGKLIMPFPKDATLPPPSSLENLNMLVESIPLQNSYKVIITGFADAQKDERSNRELSAAKANAIKIYLIGRGLEESRMEAKGLGSEVPSSAKLPNLERDVAQRVEVEFRRP